MPRKIISTLTLSLLNFIHILKFLILLYKSYFIATIKHYKPVLLENYICIIALALNLRKVSFYSIIEFFYYYFTIKRLLFLILIKGSYLSFKAFLLY